MQNYINEIQSLQNPTFQRIRQIAKNKILYLPRNKRNELWKNLNHGVDLLNSHELLCQYLFSFGNMHEAKLKDAIKHLPQNIFTKEFEIVDWGCGQGIGTICLFDYLNLKGLSKNIKKITLIEPSEQALERAVLHINSYIEDETLINSIPKFFENIEVAEIQSANKLPVIHILSNILDVKEINLKDLATKIDKALVNDNYIISVGPLNSTNKRIDAFYGYYNVPIIYDFENTQYDYGGWNTCTYKAKVYKLPYNTQGNLIPIKFYPSVQFHSAYKLDCIENNILQTLNTLKAFETFAPFDIGANVYDDIHPILAVLNNIITRGVPTKTSLFIENVFRQAFNYSTVFEEYGTLSYPKNKNIDVEKLLIWYQSVINKDEKLNYNNVDLEQLQLLFSPIAIARIQKIIIEALITNKLDLHKKKWTILVKEKDVPCSAIAFADLKEMFNKLTLLSQDYHDLKFPEFELNIISNSEFINSKLHLNNTNLSDKANEKHLNTTYDLVINFSIFETSIQKENFSEFKCNNQCYFNVFSAKKINSERNIYTTDRITYRNVVTDDGLGNYTEIKETKELLEYFVQLIFRKKSFRPGQLPILNRALQNKSVIGLLPTGGGKSLTYQLAAMLQPGVTLIVDPLRSLMKDQYDGLINVGIDSCAYINSTLSSKEKEVAEHKMEQSKLLFVFLSPERLAIYKFRKKLKNMHDLNVYFSYGVIDEVHCVSEWGHDFRFTYLHLGRNLYKYVCAKNGAVSLFGLTATASFDVLADVERELSGNGAFPLDAQTIVKYENSNRLELQYKVEKVNVEFQNEYEALKSSGYATTQKLAKYDIYIKNDIPLPVKIADKWTLFNTKQKFLQNYIKKIPNYINEIQSENSIKRIKNEFEFRQGNNTGVEVDLDTEIANNFYSKNTNYKDAGIIFCPHRSNTGVSVYGNKESLKKSIPDVGTFVGGDDDENLSDENSSMENLELFRTNKQPIMVATKAFGMGIDKPNVRFTINLNYSSSLESFVQEAGRGGRDKKMALAVIFLSDYKFVRINKKCPNNRFPLGMIKGKWFEVQDLEQILEDYSLNIDKQYINYLTPENDLVRLFCKEGERGKYFGFKDCNDKKCKLSRKCQLKKVPKEAENWIYKQDLLEILDNKNIIIDKKYIEYQNADYETMMYFYNNSFKGETIEKQAMWQILGQKYVEVFYGDDAEFKPNDTKKEIGFLTSLLDAEEGKEIVSFISYKKDNKDDIIDETDIAKAIYRMTCIDLIEDFTQDYVSKKYRIVSKRKKEGEYYKGLECFLLRYYSSDRAKEEIKNVYQIKVKSNSKLEKEIFQCLSYLTTFVYEKISVKRKRAIDDMRTFCLMGADDTKDWKDTNEELKDFIFYYFNSKYAKNDYIADNGEPYSLTIDTDDGKISTSKTLFKYLKIIDENVEQGTPIDNVKHLQGAVRLLRRSLTDSNPALSLLNAFCLFFLGTNNNENLEREVIESYKEGMLDFVERESNLNNFWKIFNEYNYILKPFSGNKIDNLKDEITIKIHNNKVKHIISKYTS